jgi:signal peptidase I
LLFPKTGVDALKGLIPGVNFAEWCTVIGRPKWWAWLLLLPVVNIFIFVGMAVDMVRSFGKYKFIHTSAAVIYAPAIFFKIARTSEDKYLGPTLDAEAAYAKKLHEAKEKGKQAEFNKLDANNPYKKGVLREWAESIIFAVFAAAFIRMFLLEAYVIPTPSMEGSLKVGDFLFVSKAHYGLRTPKTVAMVPLLHNRIPILNTESYFEKPNLPFYRLPALQPVQRNRPFVFNWPAGDSIFLTSARSYSVSQVMRNKNAYLAADPQLRKLVNNNDIITRPVDKKDHYIKRCVGVAGDSLQIINRTIYINGEAQPMPEYVQFNYKFETTGPLSITEDILQRRFEEYGLDEDYDNWGDQFGRGYVMDNEQVEKVRALDPNLKITVNGNRPDPINLFPHDPENFKGWTIDDFGPIWIPKKGATVTISPDNIALYQRIINAYEDNDLRMEGDDIYINGEKTNSYTFKQDYYWAMGDNRHNSEDSRMWGFVPHDHIVGKPLFIWFSTKNGNMADGIRWNRMFKSADVD